MGEWRRQWRPPPVFLPGKSHGRRSLVGCSPWGRKESDITEWLHFHFSLSCIGEGNATHSSVIAWRIPGTGEPGGLPFMGLYRVGHDRSDLAAADGGKVETVADFIFLNSKITADSDCRYEIKSHLLLGRKAMRNPDNVLKSRDITLPTKVCIIKLWFFQ